MYYASTPSVQVDLDVVERNIKNAVEALGAHGVNHRPHIKVHKSVQLARLAQQLGCKGITVAKLGEAEVFADGGIDDILLAFPLIGSDKLARYGALVARGVNIRTIINSIEGAKGLSALGEAMHRRLPVLIELDGGINRGGLQPGRPFETFAEAVKPLPGIEVQGVQYYGGDIYALNTAEEIRARSKKERDDIVEAGEALKKLGLKADILSGGSTFSVRFPQELEGLTEVRAGNYIFHDNTLLSIGQISPEDCALRVVSTVVARPDANHAIIDAGSKTLTTDTCANWPGYGYVVEDPATRIYKLNEEHGFVESEKPLAWKVGDTITIIPNHACTIPNLCDEIYGMRGGRFVQPIRVDARGKNR